MSRSRAMLGTTSLAVILVFAAAISTAGDRAPGPESSPAADHPRAWEVVDLAVVLDTSGSMEHLIKAARLKLWEIVHELTLFEPTPTLRVALVSYGSRANGADSGWVRVETDFTEDLDLFSDRLFGVVQDQGGTEYVARAVRAAAEALSWTPSEEALKLLFVAGNESVEQDLQVSLEEVSDLVRQKGIFPQLIFCGQPQDAAAESWARLADWSHGRFATIDHRLSAQELASPYDGELVELSGAINQTYVPRGEEGERRYRRLATQDEEAFKLSAAAAASRAEVKSSPLYSSGWDLVDAIASGEQALYEVDESELPETMRAMSLSELEEQFEALEASRQVLRDRITRLSRQRRLFIAEEIKARKIDLSRTFDAVVRQEIRERLEEKGFRLPVG